jgi:regulator of cell morphogenesis and NO signaling
MISVDRSSPLGDLAARVPGALRVFDALHIDYCCTGRRSLVDACAAHGLDADDVVARLEVAAGTSDPADTRWATRPLAALVDHLVKTYHAAARAELPRLRRLAAEAHAENPARPELRAIGTLLADLEDEMVPHMVKEERILFPYVVELESRVRAGNPRPLPPHGVKDHPLRAMMREHRHADGTVQDLRRAASSYVPPPGASPAMVTLYEGLDRLERTMHHHVHLESNVLFRRALDLERAAHGL